MPLSSCQNPSSAILYQPWSSLLETDADIHANLHSIRANVRSCYVNRPYSLRKQPTFGDATTGFPAK